jgi:hypothetical protein
MSNDANIIKFFEQLGYKVSWDISMRLGKVWWEILTPDGELICQIDKGVKLKYIIEDLKCFAEGKSGTSPVDYAICAPESEEFDTLLEKIKDIS